MKKIFRYLNLAGVLLSVFFASAYGQNPPDDLQSGIDALISEAYRSAATNFPCKLKTRGKAKMLRWENVDKCLNDARNRVDWAELSGKLQAIREGRKFQTFDINSAIESSLAAHAIPFEKIFRVKEMKALLPLSNSLLKFLPPDSLMDLPVYDKSGERVGSFSGLYKYDRSGGLSMANSFTMTLFQYTDLKGRIQTPAGRLLLDSYGVPWKEAMSQPGFRLPSEDLIREQ